MSRSDLYYCVDICFCVLMSFLPASVDRTLARSDLQLTHKIVIEDSKICNTAAKRETEDSLI